jgi:Tfp pilus assembly protein PilX
VNARLDPRRLADERGQSLVLALLALTVLAIALTSAIIFTSTNQRNSNYQKAAQVATSIAEAGVNNGISFLAKPTNSCCLNDTGLMPNTEAAAITAGAPYTGSYQGGTLTWWGVPDASGWTLHGKATVPNPTGPTASPIVKTMTAHVKVNAPPPGSFQVGVWNTIYSPYGPTSGCDTNVAQGVNVSVPLYAGGNLCLQNNAVLKAPVWAGGFLYVKNKQSGIGTKSSPVSSIVQPGANPVHIGSYCQVQNTGPLLNPCQQEPTSPPGNSNVYLSMTGAWDPQVLQANMPDFADVAAPNICWGPNTCVGDPAGGWYTASSPGPLHPCTTSSTAGPGTTTPPVFDNLVNGETTPLWGPQEGFPSGSVPGTFNLTPDGLSYTCKNAQGELSWNATTRVLTVAGTIFIDGNVTAQSSSNVPVTYTGWGSGGACTNDGDCQSVIFVTGTVLLKGVKICAVVDAANSDCNWTLYNATTNPSGWNPNKKILFFVAHSQGSQTGMTAGDGIDVGPTGTSFQGGLYADYNVNTGQGAATQGPLVSGTQTVITGQQFQGSFPSIHILPLSIQEPPTGFYLSPPTDFSYG